jgi:hypothetical protein
MEVLKWKKHIEIEVPFQIIGKGTAGKIKSIKEKHIDNDEKENAGMRCKRHR